MNDFLEACVRAARAGAKVLLDFQGRVKATEKSPKDLVTEADLASQAKVREILLEKFPDHGFLGEEDDGQLISNDSDYRWIVDPLDGTTNYVHGLPNFSVSVALERAGEILVGAVFDPVLDECFTGVVGEGAFLNGNRIRTSTCTRLEEALAAASFSAHVPRGSLEVARFIEVLHECQALRRLGSAALNLCYLAAGRLDAYWATSVKTWDVAAGMLFVREAGGVVTAVDGAPFNLARPEFAASATDKLHDELVQVLNRVVA